jgi:pimeloyl-ACP methyl ester carboxylesterase
MRMLPDELGGLACTLTGDGPAVVLLHAGVADHRMWDALVPALAERYTVVRYDLRGFGASPPPSGPFREADDLPRVLDRLGLGRVRLVGASWGGRVAFDAALVHPDRVHSLALLAPPWPGWPWSEQMREYDAAETAALAAGDLAEAVRVNLDQWLRGPARGWAEVPAGLADRLREPLRRCLAHQETVAAHSRGPGAGDPAALAVPLLVGVGALDVPDFRAIARRYAEAVPGAEFVEFARAAHLVAMDAPGELAAVLLPFLTR